jgi:hypothetical protein
MHINRKPKPKTSKKQTKKPKKRPLPKKNNPAKLTPFHRNVLTVAFL